MNRTIPLGGTDDIALLLAVTTTLFVPFPGFTIMPLDKLVGRGCPRADQIMAVGMEEPGDNAGRTPRTGPEDSSAHCSYCCNASIGTVKVARYCWRNPRS